jgi:hypothetical protein
MTRTFRAGILAVAGALALGGCTYGDYGYGGVSVGVGSGGYYGYDDPYYGGYGYPSYGWYDGYYYPGYGYHVYDRAGSRRAWRDSDRRHWEGRREASRGGWDRNRDGDGRWNGSRPDGQAGGVDRNGDGQPDWRQRRQQEGRTDGRWSGTREERQAARIERQGVRQERRENRWQERAARMPNADAATPQPSVRGEGIRRGRGGGIIRD